MNDRDAFPSYFYSKDPLPERVRLLNLADKGKPERLYWMLTMGDDQTDASPSNQKPITTTTTTTLAPYEDNEGDLLDCCDLEENYEINPTKSGKYMTSFYVPPTMLAAVVGARGAKLREFQDNTSTLIKVPRPGEPPFVKITGQSERNVASARSQIALFVLARRERMAVTHFVSFHMCSDEIKSNFVRFKRGVLEGPPTRGVDETVFQRVEKLHLTIVVLTLLDDKEVEDAKLVLTKNRESFSRFFGPSKPKITMRGVAIMNDDPTDVDVLYGKVQLDAQGDGDKFQQLANEIQDCFYKSGLVKRHYDQVKLHVTLMNSRYRKGDDSKSRSSKRESFDASHLVRDYGDYYFGQTDFDKIHLSIRSTADSVTGNYESATVLSF